MTKKTLCALLFRVPFPGSHGPFYGHMYLVTCHRCLLLRACLPAPPWCLRRADALDLAGPSVSLSASTAHAPSREDAPDVPLQYRPEGGLATRGRREGRLEPPVSSSGCPIDPAPPVAKTVHSATLTVPPLPYVAGPQGPGLFLGCPLWSLSLCPSCCWNPFRLSWQF